MASELVIEVAAGAAPDLYSIRVVHAASGGEPTATMQLDAEGLMQGLPALESTVLASAVAARRTLPVAEQPLHRVGELLFRSLFAGEVYGTYRASVGVAQQRGEQLRVVLRLTAPSLAALPWEALFDPETQTYLCRKEPLVRHVPAPYTVEPLDVEGPLRILVLIASPRDLPALDVDAEAERLTEALAGPLAEGLVELHWLRQATWSAVHARLMAGPWHVLHFIGHGDYSVDKGQGLIALVGRDGRKDLVEAERLADLLHESEPTPRLVVLNSCESGQVGTADLFSGTASALARSGINAVAAMQFSISDEAALAFARGFYTAIAHGRGVDAATRSGRIEILGVPNSLEWVTPVLYLRGDTTTLFTRTPSRRPASVPPPLAQAPPPRTRQPSVIRSPNAAPQPPSASVARTAATRSPRTPAAAAVRPRKRRWLLASIAVASVMLVWVASGPLSGLLEGLLGGDGSPTSARPVTSSRPSPVSPKPPVSPTPRVSPTSPVPPTSRVSPVGTVFFYDPNAPEVLNPRLDWHAGGSDGTGSAGSTYEVDARANTLTLTAGPGTMNWGVEQTAPIIAYPVSGDFAARVRVECDPALVSGYTGFGFGVRLRSDHASWVQIVRTHALFATRNEGGATSHLNSTPYGSGEVYLKMERDGSGLALSYSEDGASWSGLSSEDYSDLPQELEIYLFTFDSEGPPLSATFSDLRVTG